MSVYWRLNNCYWRHWLALNHQQRFGRVTGTTKLWNAGTLTVDGGTLNTGNFDRTQGTINHHNGTIKVNGGAYSQATGALIVAGNAVGKNPCCISADQEQIQESKPS